MFCCVHTTDLGAVALSSVIRAAASHTLDKYHFLRSFSIGEAFQMSFGRSCGIHHTFQFQRGDNIFTLTVSIFIVIIQFDGVKSGSNHDCTIFLCYDLIFLIIVNGSCLTYFGTYTTFSGLEFDTCLTVDHRHIRDCLGKWSVNRTSIIQSTVKFTWSLFRRAFFLTYTTSGAFVHIYASGFFTDIYSKVAYKSGNFFYFTVCINLDFFMCCCFHHLWCQNTCGTVQRRECLIKL